MEPFLIGLAIVGVIAVAAWIAYVQKQKRLAAMLELANRHGFQYSPVDIFGFVARPFQLFQKGDGRGFDSVIWGNWGGIPVMAGEYWYYTESQDSEGGTSRTTYRFSVAAVDLNARFPKVLMKRENVLSRLADHLSFRDIPFESEIFNREFQVEADDRQFTYELVDNSFMEWLLSTDRRFCFETGPTGILVFSKRLKPHEMIIPIGLTKEFHSKIPHLVWEKYGGVVHQPTQSQGTL